MTIYSDTTETNDSFDEFHTMSKTKDKLVEASKKTLKKTNKESIENSTEEETEDEEAQPEQYKSIMFSEKDSVLILDAIQYFNKSSRKGASSAESTQQANGFYLNSILYLADNKWIVWLNNRKIGSDTKHPFISVEEVNPEYVKVKWTTNDLNAISPGWKNLLSYTGKDTYESKEFDIKVKNLSKKKISTITFKIKPNQTFDPSNFTMLEGRLN